MPNSAPTNPSQTKLLDPASVAPAPERRSPVTIDLSGDISVHSRDVRAPGFIVGEDPAARTSLTATFNGKYSLSTWTDQRLTDGDLHEFDIRGGVKPLDIDTKKFGKYSVAAGAARWIYPNGDIKLADDTALDVGVTVNHAGANLNVTYLYVLPNKSHEEGHRLTVNVNRPIEFTLPTGREITVTPNLFLAHTTHFYEKGSGLAHITPGLTVSTRLTPRVGAFVGVNYQIPLNKDEQLREEILYGQGGVTF